MVPVGELEKDLKASSRGSEVVRRLRTIPGIGPITASALAACYGVEKSLQRGSHPHKTFLTLHRARFADAKNQEHDDQNDLYQKP